MAMNNYNILKNLIFRRYLKAIDKWGLLITIGRESIIFELEKVDYDETIQI